MATAVLSDDNSREVKVKCRQRCAPLPPFYLKSTISSLFVLTWSGWLFSVHLSATLVISLPDMSSPCCLLVSLALYDRVLCTATDCSHGWAVGEVGGRAHAYLPFDASLLFTSLSYCSHLLFGCDKDSFWSRWSAHHQHICSWMVWCQWGGFLLATYVTVLGWSIFKHFLVDALKAVLLSCWSLFSNSCIMFTTEIKISAYVYKSPYIFTHTYIVLSSIPNKYIAFVLNGWI